jgi:hypothetical protein
VIRPAADVSASCHVRQCGVAEDRNQESNDRVPRQFSRACRRAWASFAASISVTFFKPKLPAKFMVHINRIVFLWISLNCVQTIEKSCG